MTEMAITYKPAFKLAALQASYRGLYTRRNFYRDGFDLDVINHKKPKHSLKRWRETYNLYGEEGLTTEQRGKSSTGRKPAGELSAEEILSPSERYEIIFRTIRTYGLKRMTRYMFGCQ